MIKKILKILLLINVLLTNIIGVSAETYNDYMLKTYDVVPDTYIAQIGEGENKRWDYFYVIARASDQRWVYCIQPGKSINESALYVGNPNDYSLVENMSAEQFERIKLIAYYGYGYNDGNISHNGLNWYAATQFMIWQTVPLGYDIYFTDVIHGNRIDKFTDEINEINNLINSHNILPNFNSTNYELNIGESVTLNDTNNVLSNFEVSSSNSNISVSKSGNNLVIKGNSNGNSTITLTKKFNKYGALPIVYTGEDTQSIISSGDVDPISLTLNVKVIGGSVTIKKVDSETNGNAQGSATLSGAKYDIYDSNRKYVTTLTTDSKGMATSEKILQINKKYYIKEKSPSKGYLLDNTEYTFTLDKNNLNKTITVKEKVIKNHISILKQYDYVDGNTTFLNAEANIKFEIYYQDGTKYGEIITDENGYASIELPYGVWKFHQVNSNTGFEKINDFYVTVNETSEQQQYYNILNNKISAYLKVVKIDKETGKTIALANTKFKILNTDTNRYVSQYVGGKVYDTFSTDETGTFTTYLKLEAGNYKLVEIESPKGYLINSDGLPFSVGDNTEYYYSTYGAFITVNFENKPIKGQVEIHKTGEKFVLENSMYKYDRLLLDNIRYELYADEDIKSADGNYLYYHKGDLVETLITNQDGYAISKELPLGKYFLVEVETKENYVLNTEEYHFELTEIDNRTEIVHDIYKGFNYLKKGKLEFTKTDLVDGTPIPNVKISIYNIDDELVYSGVTDENGKIVLEDLMVGKYYIVEEEPSTGYILNDEKVYFEIKEDGEIVKANMTNEKIRGNVEFTKVDSKTNKKLQNATIIIKNSKDEIVYKGTTNKDGKILIENLEYGKYKLYEVKSPEGYVLNNEVIEFEIKENKEIIKIEMKNEKIKGKLEFTKTDFVNGNVIPNVLIEIYKASNDELVYTGYTDKDGKIIVDELEYGKYYIIEKKAPKEYLVNNKKVYFEILENGKTVKANMTDEKIKSKIILHKVDEEGKGIKGVTFGLYNLDGSLIASFETNKKGNIEFELEYDSYYLQEIKTLDNYILNDKKIYFDVTKNGEIIEKTLVNELKEIEVPNTLKIELQTIGIYAVIVAGIGTILYAVKKNKKR